MAKGTQLTTNKRKALNLEERAIGKYKTDKEERVIEFLREKIEEIERAKRLVERLQDQYETLKTKTVDQIYEEYNL